MKFNTGSEVRTVSGLRSGSHVPPGARTVEGVGRARWGLGVLPVLLFLVGLKNASRFQAIGEKERFFLN